MSKIGIYSFEPLDIFLEICKIPHASGDCESLRKWIEYRVLEFGASVSVDNVGNLLAKKGKPKICLQGHMDMVYVSENKSFNIEPYIEDGFLKAKNSSLGADNGAALACMILALRDFNNLECLFTMDEEIGMIGAKNVELDIESKIMINCDSEDINEIVCSCAGGYDLECKVKLEEIEISNNYKIVEISTKKDRFIGGHSGIEIHKDIENAILSTAYVAKKFIDDGGLLVRFSGGEKRNSIPTNAILEIALKSDYSLDIDTSLFEFKNLEFKNRAFVANNLLNGLLSVQNGVIDSDDSGVILSSNVGILRQVNDEFSIYIMGRGNKKNSMKENIKNTQEILGGFGFVSNVVDLYNPWEKEDSEFLKQVYRIFKTHNNKVKIKSIHAGLECGILKEKYPNIQFLSIGPSIFHPHSLGEKMDIESFRKFWAILCDILKTI